MAVVWVVDDDTKEVWKRLDEKYGDPGRVAHAIIDSLRRFKVIKEEDSIRFVEFVDVVDRGFRDLQRLGFGKEITTTSLVSILETKLPADIRRELAKLFTSDASSVVKTDKFPSLIQFLLNYKRAIEYYSAELRMPGYFALVRQLITLTQQQITATAGNSKKRAKRYNQTVYLMTTLPTPQVAALSTSPNLLSEERINFLKDKAACWIVPQDWSSITLV